MMLLQMTAHEKRIGETYGYTDEYGVSLIYVGDPFYFLVEQEEKYHGAMLSQTTYGMFFQTFGLLSFESDDSLNLREHNKLKKIRKSALDKSQDAHETIAKYLAFLAQAEILGYFPNKLEHIYKQSCDQYPNLLALEALLGKPLGDSMMQYEFKNHVVYTLGKIVFNTAELAFLAKMKKPEDLAACLMEERFWDKSSPTERLNKLASIFTSEMGQTLYSKYTELRNSSDVNPQEALSTPFLRFLYSFFSAHLRQQGLSVSSPLSFIDLCANGLLINLRIASVFKGVNSTMEEAPFQRTYREDSWLLNTLFLKSPEAVSRLYNFDPSFRVFYEPKSKITEKWSEVKSPEEYRRAFSRTIECAVSYISRNDDGSYTCLTLAFTGSDVSSAWRYHAPQASLKMLRSCLVHIPKDRSVIVLPDCPPKGISDTRGTFYDHLGSLGDIVFWRPIANIGYLNDSSTFYYFSREVSAWLGKVGDNSRNMLPCPLGQFQLWGDTVVISCIPFYFFETKSKLKSLNQIEQPPKILFEDPLNFLKMNTKTKLAKDKFQLLQSAMKAYQVLFSMRLMPADFSAHGSFPMLMDLINEK